MKQIIKKVLDRHTNSQANMASESFREMLAVEIECNLDKHLTAGIKEHLAKDNPLSIEMWKGYKPNKVEEQKLSKEYLDYWTCDLCGKHTHEVDYDYLGSDRNHLKCELEHENDYNEYLDEGKQMELKFPKEK